MCVPIKKDIYIYIYQKFLKVRFGATDDTFLRVFDPNA